MPTDRSKVPTWLLDLLDPGRDRRASLKFAPSGDIEFDVNRVIKSDKIQAELKLIGEMQRRQRRKESKKTRAG